MTVYIIQRSRFENNAREPREIRETCAHWSSCTACVRWYCVDRQCDPDLRYVREDHASITGPGRWGSMGGKSGQWPRGWRRAGHRRSNDEYHRGLSWTGARGCPLWDNTPICGVMWVSSHLLTGENSLTKGRELGIRDSGPASSVHSFAGGRSQGGVCPLRIRRRSWSRVLYLKLEVRYTRTGHLR